MENLKFLQDIFYNLSNKEYYQYTFTSRTENENKLNLLLVVFVLFGSTFFVTLFLTFSSKISFLFTLILFALFIYFAYNKLV